MMRRFPKAALLALAVIFLTAQPSLSADKHPGKKDKSKKQDFTLPDKSTVSFYHFRGPAPWARMKAGDPPRIAFFAGSVELKMDKLTVHADAVVLWMAHVKMDTPRGMKNETTIIEFYAEGAVYITDGTDHLSASKIFYDRTTNRGLVADALLKSSRASVKKYRRPRSMFEEAEEAPDPPPWRAGKVDLRKKIPLYIRAKELRVKALNTYEARDASLSTCNFAHPHWGLTSKKVSISPSGEVQAEGNWFDLWGIPIPLPSMRIEHDFRPPLKRSSLMHSTSFGWALLAEWNLMNRRKIDIGLITDYYTKRGQGRGLTVRYGMKNLKKTPFYGNLKVYTLDDWGEDVKGTPLDVTDRYRVRFTHRHLLPGDIKLEAVFSKMSDEDFQRYFFPKDYKSNLETGSYMFFKKVDRNRAVTLLAAGQANVFFGRREYLPEMTLYSFGERLPAGFHLDTKLRAGYVGYANDNDSGIPDPPRRGRFQFTTDLRRPTALGRFANVTPFLKFTYAGWSDGGDYGWWDNDWTRTIVDWGVIFSTELSRVFEFKSSTFQIDKLRHVFRPSVVFSKLPTNRRPTIFLETVDEVEDTTQQDRITFLVSNILQTKRKGRKGVMQPVDIARLDLKIPYLPEADDSGNKSSWGKGEADLEIYLSTTFAMGVDADFDPVSEKISAAGLALRFSPPRTGLTVYLGGRYEPELKRTLIGEVIFKPTKKWGVTFNMQKDLLVDDLRMASLIFTRNFHQWVLEVGFTRKYLAGGNETIFGIYFSPSGISKRKAGLFKNTEGETLPRF